MDSMGFIRSTVCSNPNYFPNFQMQQFQYPPQLQNEINSCCLLEEEDDELLNLAAAAAAVSCGYSPLNFEENRVLDPIFVNSNSYGVSNYGFSQNPECYFNMREDLQLPFHGDLGCYLQTLTPPFHSEPAKPLVTKSSLSVNSDCGDRKRVTAQSLAARERRRKITRKTQELGKLIPGGTKMNTAEMLQSAYKYIQFLQSQLQLLQLMSSSTFPNLQASEDMSVPPLHVVASPLIQEKLAMEGCCIIPKAFAETLLHNMSDHHPLISQQIRGICL